MDKELQGAIWGFVKDRRDALERAISEYESACVLLRRMEDAGLADHLPSLEEVRNAFNS